MTARNECSKCETTGCKICDGENENHCAVCIDPSSLIIDGKCHQFNDTTKRWDAQANVSITKTPTVPSIAAPPIITGAGASITADVTGVTGMNQAEQGAH